MNKYKKYKKLITTLLVLSMLLMSIVVLASCNKDPEVKMFNVEVTTRQFIGIETLDAYISAVDGLPLKEEDTTGSFKEGSNVEISMRINNRISAKNYKFIVRDGEVKLKELDFPDNRYVIQNLSKWEKLNVELVATGNTAPDTGGNTDPNEPDVDNICYYQIRPMHNGSQIIDPIEGRVILGQSFDIKAPNFTEKAETQYLVKKYRFSEWGSDSDMNVGGKKEQNINVTPTSNEKPLVFYANYIPLVKVELGKFATLNDSLCIDKNDMPIKGIYNYREKSIDNTISWYLAPGDKIGVEFLDESKKNRFVNWHRGNDTQNALSYSYKLNIEISENEKYNVYEAYTQPQIKISTSGKTPVYVLKDYYYTIDVPSYEKVVGVKMNGITAVEGSDWAMVPKNYNLALELRNLSGDTNYELITENAFTVCYYNATENSGTCDIKKYPIDTKTLTFTASPSIRKWRVNSKIIDAKTNTLTLNAKDISDALNKDSRIEVEAIYNPIYTNANGIIKEGVTEVDDERMKTSFDGGDFKDHKLESYLPGLNQKQSLLTEGITRIPGYNNKYLMGAYVETNETNDSMVKQRKSVLFIMDDRTGAYDQSAPIRKTLLLVEDDGSDFTGKISGLTVVNDEVLISCYDSNYIASCSLDDVKNAGTFGIITCKYKYETEYNMLTSIFYNSQYKELMIAGTSENMEKGDSEIGIIKIETNPDPRETSLYNDLGMNKYEMSHFKKRILIANRSDRNGVVCVQGIGMNMLTMKLYIIMGPDDSQYKDNNRKSEIYCIDYLGIKETTYPNGDIDIDLKKQTQSGNYKFRLPPLMREFYIDNNANGKMAFLSIGASYTRYIEPTDTTQCQCPISKLLTILVTYL